MIFLTWYRSVNKVVKYTAGFSLLELLVAFSIMSISLLVIYQSFTQSFIAMDKTGLSLQATVLAESQMARIGTELPLEETRYHGDNDQGLRWEATVQPHSELIYDDTPVTLFQVVVTVYHEDNRENILINLQTMKLGLKHEA